MTSSSLSTLSIAPSSKDLISRKLSLNSHLSVTRCKVDERAITDPVAFAKCFKYYAQFSNPYIVHPIPFERIAAKTLYNENQENFIRFFKIFRKYDLKLTDYVVFFIGEMNKHTCSIDEFFTQEMFQSYVKFLTDKAEIDKICSLTIKTAQFIASETKRLNVSSATECLKAMIHDKTIATNFFTGKLSPYFLAAIPGFQGVIPKLDHFAKDELRNLSAKFESYQVATYRAFKEKYGKKVNVLGLADEICSGRLKIN